MWIRRMRLTDVLRAMFEMPTPRPKVRMRCMTHDETFDEPLDVSFHETLNLNCKWEKLEK